MYEVGGFADDFWISGATISIAAIGQHKRPDEWYHTERFHHRSLSNFSK